MFYSVQHSGTTGEKETRLVTEIRRPTTASFNKNKEMCAFTSMNSFLSRVSTAGLHINIVINNNIQPQFSVADDQVVQVNAA